jgi:hypothetical protein
MAGFGCSPRDGNPVFKERRFTRRILARSENAPSVTVVMSSRSCFCHGRAQLQMLSGVNAISSVSGTAFLYCSYWTAGVASELKLLRLTTIIYPVGLIIDLGQDAKNRNSGLHHGSPNRATR